MIFLRRTSLAVVSMSAIVCMSGEVTSISTPTTATIDWKLQQSELAGEINSFRSKLHLDPYDQIAVQGLKEIASAKIEGASAEAMLILGYVQLKRNSFHAAIKRFSDVRSMIGADPVTYGDATLRLAMSYAGMQETEKSEPLLEAVVRGNVITSRADQMVAARALAFTYQKTGRGQVAIKLFQDLALAEESADKKAFLLLQVAGLYCEIGKSEHGELPAGTDSASYYNKAKALSGEILSKYETDSSVSSTTLATASLLHLEQDYFSGNYAPVPANVDVHLTKYPNNRVQTATALVFKMVSEFKLERYLDAVKTADTIINSAFKQDEYYDALPAPMYAYIFKKFSLERLGLSMDSEKVEDEAMRVNSSLYEMLEPQLRRRDFE